MTTLDDLRDDWLDHLTLTGAAPNTVKVYLSDLTALIDYLLERRVTSIAKVSRQRLEAYRDHLLETRSARSAARHVGTIRSWFKWLEETGAISTNPAATIKRPTFDAGPKGTYRVSRAIVERIEGEDLTARRDRAVLAVMADTGLSAAKLALIGIDDVDRKEKAILIPGKPALPLSEAGWEDLEAYTRLRNREVSEYNGHLWLSLRRGSLKYKPLSERYIQHLANQARKPVEKK